MPDGGSTGFLQTIPPDQPGIPELDSDFPELFQTFQEQIFSSFGEQAPTFDQQDADAFDVLMSQLVGSQTPSGGVLDEMAALNFILTQMQVPTVVSPETEAFSAASQQFGIDFGGAAPAGGEGGDGELSLEELIAKFMGAGDPTLDREKFEEAQSQFDLTFAAQQARDESTRLTNEANVALRGGELNLAREKFAAAQEQQDIANRLDARIQATAEANVGLRGFEAGTADITARGALESSAATNLSNLVNTIGNLSARQEELGLDILSTPRNIFPAFFLGQGRDPSSELFDMFNVKNILGIDPNQIQGLLKQALDAIGGLQGRAAAPPFDVTSLLSDLSARAGDIGADIGLDDEPPEATFQRPVAPPVAAPPPAPAPMAPAPQRGPGRLSGGIIL